MCYAVNSKVFIIRVGKYIPLREFISDVVTLRGNWRFLLMNLQVQIWGVIKALFLYPSRKGELSL
jgi:hypothetical protein